MRRLLLIAAAIAVGLWGSIQFVGARRLATAIEEADRLDPGWRLEDVLARRAVIPDAENSAPRVLKAEALLPTGWLEPSIMNTADPGKTQIEALLDSLGKAAPDAALSEPDAAALRARLADLAEALAEARAVAALPRGRYPLVPGHNFLFTDLPHCQQARKVARLLQLDAERRAHDGDTDGALDSCRALLNVGRSIGDEPLIISQLVRHAIVGVALRSIERTLMQGVPSDAALARVQRLLTDEADHPMALVVLRGERAGIDDLFEKLRRGTIPVSDLWGPAGSEPSIVDFAGVLYLGTFGRNNQALALHFMNQAVEIAKPPPREQGPLWDQWDASTRRPAGTLATIPGVLAYLLMPGTGTIGLYGRHHRARVDTTVVLVAAERARIARGRWPDSIDQIPRSILPSPPLDAFAQGPIRMARRPRGLVLYSVGPDGADDGGRLDPIFKPHLRGTDWGYTLRDPDRRRPAGRELPRDIFATEAR